MLINLWQAKLHLSLSLSSSTSTLQERQEKLESFFLESIAFVLLGKIFEITAPLSTTIKYKFNFFNFSPNSSVEFQDSFEVKPTQYAVLENPEHQSSWYARHFLGSFHQNFVGQDNDKETWVICCPITFSSWLLMRTYVWVMISSMLLTTSILSFCPINYYWHKSQLQHSTNISNFLYTNLNGETAWWTKFKMALQLFCLYSSYVLSVIEEPCYNKVSCRCIMWTKEGVKKHKLQCNLKSKSIKYILAQFESTGSRISQLPKEVSTYSVLE